MFTNRYMTKGVQSEIPAVLQIFMWDCISAVPVEKDYLQIFRLSESNGKQRIVHEQEVPNSNVNTCLHFQSRLMQRSMLLMTVTIALCF